MEPSVTSGIDERRAADREDASAVPDAAHGARLGGHDLGEAARQALAHDAPLAVGAAYVEDLVRGVAEGGLAQLVREVEALDGKWLEGHGRA